MDPASGLDAIRDVGIAHGRIVAIGQGEIRFEHVTFHYGAHDRPLYDNFSLRIAPGERVGLVGHSGSGR